MSETEVTSNRREQVGASLDAQRTADELARLTRLGCAAVDAPAAILWLADEAGRLSVAARPGVEAEPVEPPVVSPNRVVGDPRVAALGYFASVVVPIACDSGREYGLLEVLEREPRVWSSADLERLADCAAAIAARIRSEADAADLAVQVEARGRTIEEFEQLADAIHEVLFVAELPSTRLLYVSRSFERIWGRSPRDSGDRVLSLLDSIHPEDRPAALAALDHDTLGRLGAPVEYRVVRPEGEIVWVRVRSHPIRDEWGRVRRVAGVVEDVTEQKHIEDALNDSEVQFRSIIESLGDVVGVLGPSGNLAYLSPAVERVLGYTRGELVGTPFADHLHPNSLTRVTELLGQVAREVGSVHPLELWVRHKDGSWCILEAIVQHRDAASGGGIVFNARDITARRHAEQDLHDLTTALQHVAEGIARLDHEGRYVKVNQAYAEMFGFEPGCLAGVDWMETFHAEDHAALMDAYERMWADGKVEIEVRGVRGDSRTFFSRIILVAAYDDEGALTGHHCFAKDVTRWKSLGEQLRHAQRLEAIGHLAAGVAHEINTPIQYVGDNLRFLQESFEAFTALDAEYRRLGAAATDGNELAPVLKTIDQRMSELDLEYILREAPLAITQALEGVDRVAAIVRAMKEFSHPGTSEKVPMDLNHAIQSTLTVARNEWKYVADIVTNLDPNLPHVRCLPGDFNQAILNLVINAAHAVADVVGEAAATRGTITISTRALAGQVEISVQDTGTGIPESIRGLIFNPFFTTKQVGRGTGQGLTLVHAVVVEKHGGTLSFDTAVGEGTTFTIRLPLDPVSHMPQAA